MKLLKSLGVLVAWCGLAGVGGWAEIMVNIALGRETGFQETGVRIVGVFGSVFCIGVCVAGTVVAIMGIRDIWRGAE